MAEVEAYNAEAEGLHNSAMPKCSGCGRTFATEEKLATHVKSCKGGGGGGNGAVKKTVSSGESHSAKLFGMIDKDGDGKISLDELMDYQLGEGMDPDEVMKLFKNLDADHDGSLSLEEWEKGHKRYSAGPKEKQGPRMLTCYICGTQHGLASLLIHQKQCAVKYEKVHGKACPTSPPELPVPGRKATMAEVEAYNMQAQATYDASLPKCTECGRRFATVEKLAAHCKTCKPGANCGGSAFLQKGTGGGGGVGGDAGAGAIGGGGAGALQSSSLGAAGASQGASSHQKDNPDAPYVNGPGIRECMTEAPPAPKARSPVKQYEPGDPHSQEASADNPFTTQNHHFQGEPPPAPNPVSPLRNAPPPGDPHSNEASADNPFTRQNHHFG